MGRRKDISVRAQKDLYSAMYLSTLRSERKYAKHRGWDTDLIDKELVKRVKDRFTHGIRGV